MIDVDRESFVLSTKDLRDNSAGPSFPVVLGSPAHPTPDGNYPIYVVVRNPAWKPGETARARGAFPVGPSAYGPMGAAKLPFAPGGFALHGGADPLLLGKPVSLGCIRSMDRDLLVLLDWLAEKGALSLGNSLPLGESHHMVSIPIRIRIQ